MHKGVRIISGTYKGRKLKVLKENVRPTPDRVKETLFNWLMPYVNDANCLDLFAGSGSLGFEALSRGAKALTFVDNNPANITEIKNSLEKFQLNNAKAQCIDALKFIKNNTTIFDIIFCDPPYKLKLIPKLLPSFANYSNNPIIYVEDDTDLTSIITPDFEILKNGKAGHVYFYLIRRTL